MFGFASLFCICRRLFWLWIYFFSDEKFTRLPTGKGMISYIVIAVNDYFLWYIVTQGDTPLTGECPRSVGQ
jgi:hypothetical protein